jgi:S-adenosylmethionine uptake transporter
MAVAVRARTQTRGIVCILLGMVALSLQDTIIKWVSGDYPLHEIVLTRAAIAVVLTAVFAHYTGGLGILKTRRLGLQVVRGLLLTVANMAYFLALAAMPLAEAAALFFVAPLLITALAVPFLGERVGLRRWVAVLVGLAGVVVMLRPGGGSVQAVALLPVLAAFCYACMQMLTRRLGVTDSAASMAFYVQSTFVVVSAGIGVALGDGAHAGGGHPSLEFLLRAWAWPDLVDGVLFVACGFLVGGGALLLSQAYRVSEANVVAPFEYAALPMAVLWGFLLWGDVPDAVAVLGMALIVGSGLFVFYRETVRGRPLAARRPVPRNR